MYNDSIYVVANKFLENQFSIFYLPPCQILSFKLTWNYPSALLKDNYFLFLLNVYIQ